MNKLNEDRFRDLKQRVEQSKAEAERAKGALDQIRSTLKNDFGCDSMDSAQRKLAKMVKSLDELKEQLATRLEAYEKKWNQSDES